MCSDDSEKIDDVGEDGLESGRLKERVKVELEGGADGVEEQAEVDSALPRLGQVCDAICKFPCIPTQGAPQI